MKSKRLFFWRNRIKFRFPVRRSGKKFQFVIDSRHKKAVKSLKYVLTILGLVSAFFAFQTMFISFLFGVGLFGIGYLIEKTLFSYKTMYVHPMPDFGLEQDKWTGVAFGYATHKDMQGKIPVVGWVFSDPTYARKIHSLLLTWTHNELDDRNVNLKMSVILHAKNQYSFYCYPSTNRPLAKSFYKQIEAEMQSEKATRDDLHEKLIVMMILGKLFDMPSTSMLPTFKKNYGRGSPFIFQMLLQNPDGSTAPIPGISEFLLYDLKIMPDTELSRQDVEYDLNRFYSKKRT